MFMTRSRTCGHPVPVWRPGGAHWEWLCCTGTFMLLEDLMGLQVIGLCQISFKPRVSQLLQTALESLDETVFFWEVLEFTFPSNWPIQVPTSRISYEFPFKIFITFCIFFLWEWYNEHIYLENLFLKYQNLNLVIHVIFSTCPFAE